MSKTAKKYPEYKTLNLPSIAGEVLDFWNANDIFHKSVAAGNKNFVFYEGPPSANGLPGIHHVISRTIKDLFCRYKTLKGYKVLRKGGWDTHGLPVELQVEKDLGITREEIGKQISIEEYNRKCRETVMKYKQDWDDLTRKMGYWVDLENPYITFENNYIETLWWLLRQLYDKGLLYKGYTIQPYSPAAGTGLSSHELNLPGCYRNVRDNSVTAQFKVIDDRHSKSVFSITGKGISVYFLAWTTTPWTLPSNSALAVGHDIDYILAKVKHPKSGEEQYVICSRDYLPAVQSEAEISGDPAIIKGSQLTGVRYEQLLDWVKPGGDAFRVITGDFVTTGEGTGIVHIAPTFGADDFRAARENNIPPVVVKDAAGNPMPLVDRQGKFVKEVTDFAGRYVRPEYEDGRKEEHPVDVDIIIKLFREGKAWSKAKYEHSYPHCWRTDKPVIYYPLDSWFIRTTAVKEQLIALNQTINWKPASTGKGRFETWLANLVDWNLSRSRFWGTPLPIWRTEDGRTEKCIGSIEELRKEADASVRAGNMKAPLGKEIDLHRPYVDDIILTSPDGKKMHRETDLVDVWFDSGAMPYAQCHYPFENRDFFKNNFPADFIAEGVDQTRGWFFTLHAIAAMVSGSVAFRNVVSNGLVLDKAGNKMSKRTGNVVDPFATIEKYGADATRWYMISNAQPWDNLKFDESAIQEVQRKFFGTLFNTYAFFALYANIDGFTGGEAEVPWERRPETDRWILSMLNSLVRDAGADYEDYEPTRATRRLEEFTDRHLSNWYVRLSRRRFWKGEMNEDKLSAYQTLHKCLEVTAVLMSPVAPFFADFLYRNVSSVSGKGTESVHLASFPEPDEKTYDAGLEERMNIAQDISSLVLALRKKVKIRVRQPLQKILVPVADKHFEQQVKKVEGLILAETNVKMIEYVSDTAGTVSRKVKPDFRKLGAKWGSRMKEVATATASLSPQSITALEKEGSVLLIPGPGSVTLLREEVEIIFEDIPGWLAGSAGGITVALDITITEQLKDEGNARELVNRIQKFRKEQGFEVTDRIRVKIKPDKEIRSAIIHYKDYICREILAVTLDMDENVEGTALDINDRIIHVQVIKN